MLGVPFRLFSLLGYAVGSLLLGGAAIESRNTAWHSGLTSLEVWPGSELNGNR